ncbi:chemotaxis protein CheB, partial [Cellulomonas sp. APG4]|uniref:CheB methylesterase domain-containing protein n=1 Tax=Cellulomonas sp. APG4 TaxID=1538656 RepID=UPI00137A2F73
AATAAPAARAARPTASLRPRPEPHPVRAVVIGSSTGGPEALSRVLAGLTAPLPVPVLVVQHMPPVFTRQLAARLDRVGPSTVVEAAGGERLEAGTVYIAPGDLHLEVGGTDTLHTQLTQAPPVNFCRPSVDVMFRSAVRAYGGDLLAVMLTGMGADGRSASAELVENGGTLIAQDEATSVVWGMPGAVATAGLVHALLPLDAVAEAVQRTVQEAPRATARRRSYVGGGAS